jgi:glycosyltransferase involved in cell wall biosynthesis
MVGAFGELSGLRIAHLIESDGPGGAERVVVQLARTLQAAGAWNMAVLPANGEGWLARELEGSGVTIEYFTPERRFASAFVSWLETTLRRHRIAVAHSHEFSMAVYGAWGALRARVPHVITMHGGLYYAARLRRRLALRAAIAASARTVAVSRSLSGRIGRDLWIPEQRIDTIPNGVHYKRPERTTLRDDLRLTRYDRLLVSVGNLYPVKGHQHLVKALAILAAPHPTLHLAIAGRGEMADTLATCARELGVEHRVHLLGLRSDIPAILAAADIFVLPSLSEGLPLALLEAMFAGRPIVASDVGEVGVALAHGDAGMLVEPGNPHALAAAIESLLCNPNRAKNLADRAARRAVAEYDVARMVRRYIGLYEEEISASQSARPVSRAPRSNLVSFCQAPVHAPTRSEQR